MIMGIMFTSLGIILGVVLWLSTIPLSTVKITLKTLQAKRKAKEKQNKKVEKKKAKKKSKKKKSRKKKKGKGKDSEEGANKKQAPKGVKAKIKETAKKGAKVAIKATTKAAIATLTFTIQVIRTLSFVVIALAPIFGLFLIVTVVLMFSSVSFFGTDDMDGSRMSSTAYGYAHMTGSSDIVLLDGRSIIQFLNSTDADYGPLASENYEYVKGNQFTSLNTAIVWYLDHIVVWDDPTTNKVTYYPSGQTPTEKAHTYWKDTLGFYPRDWYTESDANSALDSAVSSYNDSVDAYWALSDEERQNASAPGSFSGISQPDKNNFKQDDPNKSPVEHKVTRSVRSGKSGTTTWRGSIYSYIKDNSSLDKTTFELNSLYRYDFTKIIDKDSSRLLAEGDGEDDTGKILYFIGTGDEITNAKGRSNHDGFIDFYVTTLSDGTAFHDFNSLKGKTYDELSQMQCEGWTIRAINSQSDLSTCCYGDILYSGYDYDVFLAYDMASGSAFTWNWDTIRNSFPDKGSINITTNLVPNNNKAYYLAFHYSGTGAVPEVDDIKAGVAVQITTGTTGVGLSSLSVSGTQPVSTDRTYIDWVLAGGFAKDAATAQKPGIVTAVSSTRVMAAVPWVKYTREAGWFSKGVLSVTQAFDGCPTSGTSEWINRTPLAQFQAFTNTYTYTQGDWLSTARALQTYLMDNRVWYDQNAYYQIPFADNKSMRQDCSGFASMYLYLMTGRSDESVINKTSSDYASGMTAPAGWTFYRDADETQFKTILTAGDILFKKGHCELFLGIWEINGSQYWLTTGWGSRQIAFPSGVTASSEVTISKGHLYGVKDGGESGYSGFLHKN